jgi:hypothetical protein
MPRYTETDVRRAVAQSVCLTDALRKLGLRPAGGNHGTLKKLIARYAISTAHFDPLAARARHPARRTIPLSQVLVRGSTYDRGRLKRRLLAMGLKANACEMCGQDERWRGRVMALILDHVNGVPTDNRLENLRIVCPNCAATLDTHCGRKNRSRPAQCACQTCGQLYFTSRAQQRFCSLACAGQGTARQRGLRPSAWKVPHPPYAQLRQDVAQHGFRATGRRYGVSDNAIRKWLRQYERYGDLPRDHHPPPGTTIPP